MDKVLDLVNSFEKENGNLFKDLDEISFINSKKVLKAFKDNNVNESDFAGTNGYGYDDAGRDKIEAVFAEVLGGEDALVRPQLISGTHALTVCFFGLLRPGDMLLSINGKPYDTLDEVIGIRENPSSLKAFKVNYNQIDLVNNDFDYDKIRDYLSKNKVKVIEIQRSVGYANRDTISIEKVERVCNLIKSVSPDTIIMVDNCYCEFVSTKEPIEVGADIMVGSLIKNLGAGIASTGAYIVGRRDLVNLCSQRLTAPGEGKEIGPSLGINRSFLQGIYMAPQAVVNALKTGMLASYILEKLGVEVYPKYNEVRSDIVTRIIFNDKDKLIKFTQGSSIEISCDGPIRSPYIAYLQGGITYDYGKLAVINAISNILKNND